MLSGLLSTLTSPKFEDLLRDPHVSLTYWNPVQDTCTADCAVELLSGEDEREDAWRRFAQTPPPAGFDPAHYPEWESSRSPAFGAFLLRPSRLRVMPGTLMTDGVGEVLTWTRL